MYQTFDDLPGNAKALLSRLGVISQKGLIPAVMKGDGAVGMTLLDQLGVDYTSSRKPDFQGIIVTARRNQPRTLRNRVNLFAKVPDWSISACKSAREIVDRHGYPGPDGKGKLHCTVDARHANSKGLRLQVDVHGGLLHEVRTCDGVAEPVATWRIETLKKRLSERRPASMWVVANSHNNAGVEYFQYRDAVYTGSPKSEDFAQLLAQGTITVDHQIDRSANGATDKGPHFKILPRNIFMLFPEPVRFDLLSI